MRLTPTVLKFIAAVALFALWAALVWTRLVPAGDLAHAIEAALLGLGVFHAASGNAASQAVPPTPPAVAAPPQQPPAA